MDTRRSNFYTQVNGAKTIKNYRPITAIAIIYKRWEIITNRRITPLTNILTTAQQSAYKQGVSTIDTRP